MQKIMQLLSVLTLIPSLLNVERHPQLIPKLKDIYKAENGTISYVKGGPNKIKFQK